MKLIHIAISLLALYGVIILIQKIRFNSSVADKRVKKGDGYSYWIEPFRRKCDCNLCSQDWANANNYGCDYSVACENSCN